MPCNVAGEIRGRNCESGKNLWKSKPEVPDIAMIANHAVLNFSAISSTAQEKNLLESGTLIVTHCGRTSLFLVASVLIAVGSADSQQRAASVAGQSPAVDAAQPVSQAAQGSNGENNGKAKNDMGQNSPEGTMVVKLGAGDLIEVSVYNVPELSTKARVSNSGDIYLPLIDYVHVEGLTQEEAQALIEKRLSDGGFVRDPHVTIFVDDASSQGVTILGEVSKPGIYPDIADHKLYEMISQAGGFTPSASRDIAILRRNQNEPIRITLPRNLADDVKGNIEIQPGDTITVPKAPIIYVVGDVGRPAGFAVDNGQLTVLQALALAGGINRTAQLSGARIIHKGPNGMTETKVEIKKMLRAKSPDVVLQADDILFVPVSGAKVAAGRTAQAAMSVATALTIYTVHP
jgi:polysaccharide export outer membrane protein